jgi:shikimate dehydrogenase
MQRAGVEPLLLEAKEGLALLNGTQAMTAVGGLALVDAWKLAEAADVIGAMKPLEEMIGLRGARVAVIGAGGSARAICYGLSQRGANVTIFARNLKKALPLAQEFNAKLMALSAFKGETEIVINCTPIGMRHHSEDQSPLNFESLQGVKLVYDLIYTPEETALLRDAKSANCQTLGGLAMLIGQAAEQFRLWTGTSPPVDVFWQTLGR